jgi:hypothetical protein
MGAWLVLFGGLLIWAAHFFAIYAIASIFPGTGFGRWLTLIATVIGLVGVAWIIWWSTLRRDVGDQFDRWIWRFGVVAATLSFVAILWQGFPALV